MFLLGGIGFVYLTLFASWILRPKRPNEEKLSTYESGEDTVGNAWGQFNIRFYIIAIVFLLFEVELVFLFPWATVFADQELMAMTDGAWGKFALIETFIFVFLLAVGLLYVWKNGLLTWVRPRQKPSDFRSPIPTKAYKQYLKR